MAWFDVDDKIADSPGVMRLTRRYRAAAMGVWTLCGAWLSSHLNDDLFVPDEVIRQYCGTPTLVDELVRAGFWERRRAGVAYTTQGCRVRTAESVHAQRSAGAQRVAKHRAAKQKPPDQQEPDNVTVLQPEEVTHYPGMVTKETIPYPTEDSGYPNNPQNVSNAGRPNGRETMDISALVGNPQRPPPAAPQELRNGQVATWAGSLVRRCLTANRWDNATQTDLRMQVQELRNQEVPEEVIEAALRLFDTEPGPGGRRRLRLFLVDANREVRPGAAPRTAYERKTAANAAVIDKWIKKGQGN